jgi:glycosyltransferase involved in cell wall biosynthesis
MTDTHEQFQKTNLSNWVNFITVMGAVTPLLAFLIYLFPDQRSILMGKDLLVMAMAAYLLLSRPFKIPVILLAFLPFLGICLIDFALSDAGFQAKTGSLRQILVPILFLAMGAIWGLRADDILKSRPMMKNRLWYFIIAGLILYLLPAHYVGWLKTYFEAKGTDISEFGIPAQWLEPVFGGIPRMVSTFFDPINWGHFLVFSLFIFIPKIKKTEDYVLSAMILLSLALSFCKGAWLQLSIMTGILYFPLPRWLKAVGLAFVPVLVFVAAGYHDGIRNHQTGFENALKTLSFFGHGLGKTGNVALIFNDKAEPFIFDTYVGAIIGQTGLLGTGLWVLGWTVVLIGLFKTNRTLGLLLFSQLFVSCYSDNAFNLLSVMAVCLYAGAELTRSLPKGNKIAIADPVGVNAGMDYFSGQLNRAFQKLGLESRLYSNFQVDGNSTVESVFQSNKDVQRNKLTDYFRGHIILFNRAWKRDENRILFHSFKTSLKETVAITWAKILKNEIHVIVHDVEGFDPDDSLLLKKWVFRILADQIYCLNETSRKQFCQLTGINPDQIHLIHHGHFLDLPNPEINRTNAREKLGLDPDEFYFLFFGQIKPVKGLDILIEAMAKTGKGKLIIAGKERLDSFSVYKQQIQSLGLNERVLSFIRYIENEERELFFKACDCVVLPYRKIFQSGVLLMSMSYGKPVIVSDLEANQEIILHGKNGLLFRSGDAGSLADCMNQLIAEKDPGVMIQSAIKTLQEHFNWEDSANVIANQITGKP